jgi:hypothetical protein
MLKIWFISNTILWPYSIDLAGLRLGFNVMILAIIGIIYAIKNKNIGLFLFLIALGFFHLLIIIPLRIDEYFYIKSVLTLPIFCFLAWFGIKIGQKSSETDWRELILVAKGCILVILFSILIEYLFPTAFPDTLRYRIEGKYSGIYSEPSFLAFSVYPCILLTLLSHNQHRFIWLLVSILIAYLSPSFTLIAFIFITLVFLFFTALSWKNKLKIILTLSFTIIYFYLYNEGGTSESINRLNGIFDPSENSHLSSLVYLQGWVDLYNNLLNTYGLGLGFNGMGSLLFEENYPREVILSRFGLNLNSEDGSFLFSKIISEFGLFGLLFYSIIFYKFISKINENQYLVINTLVFSFIIISFVRTSGYFNGTLLLIVPALSIYLMGSKLK